MEASVKLYTLNFDEARTYLWAALFVVSGMVLPQVFHLIPQGGIIFAPLSLVILAGAYKFGWKTGLMAAVATPLVNNLVFGLPAWGVLPIMAVKLAMLALAAGLAVQRMQRVTLPMLCGAVLLSELVGGMAELAFTGGLHATIADFTIGWPGLLLQIAGCYLIVNFIWKR